MDDGFSRRDALVVLGGLAAAALTPPARAAAFPTRPVKLLVGATPGGPSDFIARLYSDSMASPLGQSLIVDNKPGASGTLAADAAAKSVPDGHTLLVSGPTAITTAPHLFKLTYDPVTDFVPVNMLAAGAFVLAVHPSVPANSVQELVALARNKPGALAFGSGGNGSTSHLSAELFGSMSGAKMFHVPYKGDGQALNDLVAGQIQVIFTAPNVAIPQLKAGRLRPLAVTSRERMAVIADVPTVSESGVKDFESLAWIILFAPATTPRPAIDALVAAWAKARGTPAVRGRLEELAMVAPDRLAAGEPLAQFVKAESVRLGKLIRDIGIKAD